MSCVFFTSTHSTGCNTKHYRRKTGFLGALLAATFKGVFPPRKGCCLALIGDDGSSRKTFKTSFRSVAGMDEEFPGLVVKFGIAYIQVCVVFLLIYFERKSVGAGWLLPRIQKQLRISYNIEWTNVV